MVNCHGGTLERLLFSLFWRGRGDGRFSQLPALGLSSGDCGGLVQGRMEHTDLAARQMETQHGTWSLWLRKWAPQNGMIYAGPANQPPNGHGAEPMAPAPGWMSMDLPPISMFTRGFQCFDHHSHLYLIMHAMSFPKVGIPKEHTGLCVHT